MSRKMFNFTIHHIGQSLVLLAVMVLIKIPLSLINELRTNVNVVWCFRCVDCPLEVAVLSLFKKFFFDFYFIITEHVWILKLSFLIEEVFKTLTLT